MSKTPHDIARDNNPMRLHSFQDPGNLRKYCVKLSNWVIANKITPQQAQAVRGLMQIALNTLAYEDYNERFQAIEKSIKKLKKLGIRV